jgi:hypothetical protein
MRNKSLSTRKASLDVKGTAIAVVSQKGDDYICLTDIARYKDSERTDYITAIPSSFSVFGNS